MSSFGGEVEEVFGEEARALAAWVDKVVARRRRARAFW